MKTKKEKLKEWFKDIFNYKNIDGHIIEEPLNVEDEFNFLIYTNNYKYIFYVNENYLAGSVQNRKEMPGEDWFRGRDLSDGKFSKETFTNIIFNIIQHESVITGIQDKDGK